MKKKIIYIFLILVSILFVSFWIIVSGGYDKQNKTILFLKEIIPISLAKKVRDSIFFIPRLQDRNKFLEIQLSKYEQGLNGNLFFEKKISDKKTHNYYLKKFFLPFPSLDLAVGWQAKKNSKRAHYLELIDDKVLVISGEGETIYFSKENINKKKLSQSYIKNNLEELFSNQGTVLAAIRDLYYEDDFIYISVVELQDNKSTLNIYRAKKNFKYLIFEKFFETKTFYNEYTLQTGGRLEKFNDDEILLSIGFFSRYESAQDEKSLFGKIISINKETREYSIQSMGHRNTQGLFFLKEKNLIINSEHGPKGGDEVNVNFLKKDIKELPNYGWPIASYGVPYPQQDKSFFEDKGYLKKSHSKNGFIEPLKFFTPSIGISEISYNKNNLYVSSLRAQSIYILELSEDFKLKDQKRIKFDSRIRDIKYDKEKDLFLIMFENIPALGVLKFI